MRSRERFFRMSDESPFSLRSIRPSDAEAVQRLWDTRFGGKPSTQTRWIEAALDRDHSATGHVAVGRTEKRVVGFGLLEVGSPAYTRDYLGLDTLNLSPPLSDRNGILHMYCVHANWEGKGIGTTLYGLHLDLLAERGVQHALGIAWHRPDGPPDSRMLFEKWDFTAFATVDRYYSQTGSRPHCPACEDDCTCTASLYARRVDEI